MGEADSLCEEFVRLWPKQFSPSYFPKGETAPPNSHWALGNATAPGAGFQPGEGSAIPPKQWAKVCLLTDRSWAANRADLSWRSIHLESFTPLATWNKPSLCVIAMFPNYLWLTNYLSVNTIYSQSACLWCHTRILILCTALLHFS